MMWLVPIAIQPDGKLLVAGRHKHQSLLCLGPLSNIDGTLDPRLLDAFFSYIVPAANSSSH
jgi:hypothetical protein